MKHYADKCRRNNFNHAPKATWDIVRDMIKGFQGHFKNKAPKQFKNPEGITGTDDHTNADIIQQYYQGVYSQEVNIDQSEIDKLLQCQFNYELGELPTYQEVTSNQTHHKRKSPRTNRHHHRHVTKTRRIYVCNILGLEHGILPHVTHTLLQ